MQPSRYQTNNRTFHLAVITMGMLFVLIVFCLFLAFLYKEGGRDLLSLSPYNQAWGLQGSVTPPTATPFLPLLEEGNGVTKVMFTATASPIRRASPTISPTVTVTAHPTVVLQPSAAGTLYPLYVVRAGDQVEDIAQGLQVSAETLRAINFMSGDAILPGQVLIVPPDNTYPETAYRFASLDKSKGDAFYPLWLDTPRFRMRYMPDTYPGVDPNAVAYLFEQGLPFVEQAFDQPLDFVFDIYVAGTLYEQPYSYQLGQAYSLERKIFFLHNGSGDAVYQQYLAAHELTHLYAWNTFGYPASLLVSEGTAVYTGMKMIDGSKYLPLKTFCAIYKKEHRLPLLYLKKDLEDFRGHNNNLVNYYASGCLVGYLIEHYGVEKFAQLYHSENYEGIYGQPLAKLEEEWKASISTDGVVDTIDTQRFMQAVDRFMATNEAFYATFDGSSKVNAAYYQLDKARLALLVGDLDSFDVYMQRFKEETQQEP